METRFLCFCLVALPSLSAMPTSNATTIACEGAHDGVRATKRIEVPQGEREAFIKYIQEKGPSASLSYAAVESDRRLTMFLQNVDAGIIAVTIENTKPERVFVLSIETCNAKRDWRPHWKYVLELVDAFGGKLKPRASASILPARFSS
jgi:hypothetical protein